MNARELIHRMPSAFDSEAASDVTATVQYELSQPMYIVIEQGQCSVHEGRTSDADLTLSMDDDDFIALMRGDLNGMAAFMTGQLTLDGDLTLANRLADFFDNNKL